MDRTFTVNVDGATLSGEQRGDGAPLVLVHGMAGERGDWDRLLAELPRDMPLLRYDLRGFGRSAASEGIAFSHSDDLLALLDAREMESVALCGLSMGGAIALNFALSHPQRVEKLVLVSPAMVGWDWSGEWKTLWRGISDAARAGDLDTAREQWWQHPMFAAAREGNSAAPLRHAIAAYHGRQWVHDDQRAELPDLDRLHTLSVAALLLSGERDVADMRLIADMIAAAAPTVTRRDFAGAGHMLHLERPRDVAAAITAFLEAA